MGKKIRWQGAVTIASFIKWGTVNPINAFGTRDNLLLS